MPILLCPRKIYFHIMYYFTDIILQQGSFTLFSASDYTACTFFACMWQKSSPYATMKLFTQFSFLTLKEETPWESVLFYTPPATSS